MPANFLKISASAARMIGLFCMSAHPPTKEILKLILLTAFRKENILKVSELIFVYKIVTGCLIMKYK